VEHVPTVRHGHSGPREARNARKAPRQWRYGTLGRRTATVVGAAALVSLVLPTGLGSAAPANPGPDLQTLVARARTLSNEINSLDEQYNGLRVALSQARAESQVAQRTYAQDIVRLSAGQLSIGQLAAQSYMNNGLDTSLQLLTTSSAQNLLSRASLMDQLQTENGDRVGQMAAAVAAAQRARETSIQQGKIMSKLTAEMAVKRAAAQKKINILNSAVFARAMATFNQTGNWPVINLPTANTVGEEALRAAISREGDPYVWGAAGPSAFDCSGLVLWAYAQVGISLPHFTGDQWNMGVHVPRADLQPGDLVFFYADIGHVGLFMGYYKGQAMMLDAPNFGETVREEPIDWSIYVGAVQIPG
jgi:peptidoglycan DL-endopeptidase CwlO